MKTVELCSPSSGKPLEGFIDATTRTMCLHPNEGCELNVIVDEPCFLTVEVDGEQQCARPLTQGAQQLPLAELFAQPSSGLFTSKSRSRFPTKFTVSIRDSGPDGPVKGTYDFRLLDAPAYTGAYEQCLRGRDNRREPPRFTTDARQPHQTLKCWNCQAVLCGCSMKCDECGCDQ